MSNTLLEFKNLVTEFRTEGTTVKAVNDISFTLNKGETVGIVGESGSGKSVTSLSAMRLIPSPPGIISGGGIVFHKKNKEKVDLLKISEDQMRSYRGNDLAMIFQEPMTSLNPVFTCGNQVLEAIMLHQRTKEKSEWNIHFNIFLLLVGITALFFYILFCSRFRSKFFLVIRFDLFYTSDYSHLAVKSPEGPSKFYPTEKKS